MLAAVALAPSRAVADPSAAAVAATSASAAAIAEGAELDEAEAPVAEAAEAQKAEAGGHEEKGLDVKEIIFHHLGDGYGWEVPFSHVYRIPLPVIVRAEDGQWFCFSSGRLTKVETVMGADGKEKHEQVPVIYTAERDGKQYQFAISHVSAHKNKVVQIFALTPAEQAEVHAQALKLAGAEGGHHTVVPGYAMVGEEYYKEYKPWDISITKNVLALFIAVTLVTAMMMGLVRHYRKKGFQAPRKGMGFLEMLIDFIYTGVIKGVLGKKANKFAPYLLTCFFFILTMNLVGLIVIFPGGANLTGNIAVTLVLATLTFVVTNVMGNKHYWKEIFWPDVPIWLKCPLPIMQVIEIFGIFTKPAALCVRLFANMMGGHMIVITLTLLIFIFAAFGAVALGASTVISVAFTLFMLALDVLVSFIQAYVFTLLSAMFIGMGQEEHHEHEAHEVHDGGKLDDNSPAIEA